MANRIRRIAGCAALTLALTAATAEASERFASPTGMGSGCTLSQPCDIVTAINDAANGDDIDIAPGTYGSPTPIATSLSDNSKTLTIHGQAGEPMPVIRTDATDFGIGLSGGSTLSYVDVEDSSNSSRVVGIEVNTLPPVGEETEIDHVISVVSGTGDPVACLPIGTLVDSLCWSSGADGIGAWVQTAGPATQSATLVNDTLIASGSGGDGVLVSATGGFTATLNMTNSIANGTGADVYMDAGALSTAVLNADHSNYAEIANAGDGGTVTATPVGSGTNQTAAPQFLDAAAGNFGERASSPTVGKGVTTALAGQTDLDGLPWSSPPDIGASQFYNAPACHAASASTKFGTAVSVQLQCADALGDPMTLAIDSGPSHGKLSAISGGSVTYTPNPGYSGSDSFTYTGSSRLGTSAPATVSVTVAAKSSGKAPAPVISHAKQSKGVFTFILNERATVTFVFRLHGHIRGSRIIGGKVGNNTVHVVKGRLSKHYRLKAGRYVVTITAANAAGRSKPVRVKYRLAARGIKR